MSMSKKEVYEISLTKEELTFALTEVVDEYLQANLSDHNNTQKHMVIREGSSWSSVVDEIIENKSKILESFVNTIDIYIDI